MTTRLRTIVCLAPLLISALGCKQANTSKSISTDDTEQTEIKIDYSNPVLIAGTSFGEYLQTLYKVGQFNEMLKFTSAESIKKYGKAEVLNFYEHKLNWAYKMKLKSKQQVNDTIILNYQTSIMATSRIIRVKCKIENDSCKLILSKISGSNPFE